MPSDRSSVYSSSDEEFFLSDHDSSRQATINQNHNFLNESRDSDSDSDSEIQLNSEDFLGSDSRRSHLLSTLHRYNLKTAKIGNANKSRNTLRNYKNRVKLFTAYCKIEGHHDGSTVTETKLNAFLHCCVSL